MKAKKLLIGILTAFSALTTYAQTQTLISPTEHLILTFDINEESILVPTMEDFGPMHGYLKGYQEKKGEPYFYGVWTVTKIADEGKKGIMMHISNDFGSETQEAHLRQTSDSTWTLHLEGQKVMKRVVGRKLIKISDDLEFVTSADA